MIATPSRTSTTASRSSRGTLTTTGNKFVMEDYQIVNGSPNEPCLVPTSESNITDEVHVPIKVIATADDDLTNAVIRATNSQTPIGMDDLQALLGSKRS